MNKSLLKLFTIFFLTVFITISTHAQLVPDFRVNDDLISSPQYGGKMGLDGEGNFIVVWEDWRINDNPNIYCQIYFKNYQRRGSNIKLTDSISLDPSVSVLKDGRFGISWHDHYKIKFRIFNRDGFAITDEIGVNDSIGIELPLIDSDSSGNFSIVWQQYLGSNKDIFFQRFDSLGNKLGINKKVNDDIDFRQERPDISVQKEGSFIITWQDNRSPSGITAPDIYMQLYNRNGSKIGINKKVSEDTVNLNTQNFPKISSETSGKFCIIFNNYDLNAMALDIHGQLYDKNGLKIGNNFVAIASPEDEGLRALTKKDNGDFVIGYEEAMLSKTSQYFQRFTSTGAPIGGKYKVSTQAPFLPKFITSIKIFNDKIYSLWSDERNGNFDIYCNVRSFSNPDTTVNIIKISNEVPSEYKLYQNYPNPFNPFTKIRFSIPQDARSEMRYVKLIVIDLLGKEVRTIIDKNLISGSYEIDFDGSDLSSGVYLYRLLVSSLSVNAENYSDQKKFVLIK